MEGEEDSRAKSNLKGLREMKGPLSTRRSYGDDPG